MGDGKSGQILTVDCMSGNGKDYKMSRKDCCSILSVSGKEDTFCGYKKNFKLQTWEYSKEGGRIQ